MTESKRMTITEVHELLLDMLSYIDNIFLHKCMGEIQSEFERKMLSKSKNK